MDPAIAPPSPTAPAAPHPVQDDPSVGVGPVLRGGEHRHAPVGTGITPRQRFGRVGSLVAAAGITAYVGTVDPSSGGAYPLCPSRSLFGIDCPACGGLRGTHDLLRGDIVGALDHNLLLPVLLVVYAVVIGLWLRPLVGRAVRPVHVPRWLLATGAVVAIGFTVLRNLPVGSLEFLASSAEW